MMNQQTNIQTVDVDVNIKLLLDVFLKYGVTTSNPIDYNEFVKDIISVSLPSTKTFIYDPDSISYSL